MPRLPSSTVRLRPEQLEDRAVPAVYTVTGTADEPLPGTITATGTGTFNASSLRAAVLAANQTAADDTIILGAGNYALTVDGRGEDSGATGDLDIRNAQFAGKLTIIGAGSGSTSITGAFSDGNEDRLLDSYLGDLTLNNLTLSGGAANYGSSDDGGAIRMLSGNLTLSNVVVTDNSAYGYGGGIYFVSYGGFFFYGVGQNPNTFRITNSVISDNTSGFASYSYGSGNGGGGIFVSNFGGTFEMTGSTVSGNTVILGGEGSGGGGGVLLNTYLGTSISNSVISGNSVQSSYGSDARGGGLLSYSTGINGGLTISNSTITGNSVVGSSNSYYGGDGEGGGIFARGGLTIIGSTISNNIAQGGSPNLTGGEGSGGDALGGGIYVSGGEGFSMLNSTVSGNQAIGGSVTSTGGNSVGYLYAGDALGGGIFSPYSFQAFSSIRNTTIANNSAVAGNVTTDGTENTNTGFARGGGILGAEGSSGLLSLASTLVATNTVSNPFDGTAVAGPDLAGNFLTFGNNLIGDGTDSTGLTNGTSGDLVGTDTSPIDPLIGPLADNGGPTQTHALLAGSPAINGGSNLSGLSTDQRGNGFYRTFGGGTDIGAFEFQTAYVPLIAAGSASGPAQLRVLNSDGTVKFENLNPFPGFDGIVYTATGDFNGDRVDDIVVGAGVGGGPHIKVFDGVTGAEIASFFAFEDFARGGVTIAVADVNADGVPDIIAGAGVGGGPRVRVINGTMLDSIDTAGVITESATLLSFFAFDANWRGGITVAYADGQYVIGRGGVSDGTSVPAEVALADGAGNVFKIFQVLDNSFVGSVNVAAGGGVIAIGAGLGGGPRVELYDTQGNQTDNFFAFDPAFMGGVSVGILGNGDDLTLLAAAGPGGGPQINQYSLTGELITSFAAFDPTFTGGVFVG